MTRFLWRLTLVAAIGWAGYIAAHASWTYVATRDAIDSAVREAASRYRSPLTTGRFTDTMLAEVRDSVVQVAGQGGLPVQAGNVAVRASVTGISATVHYFYPVITLQGMDFVAVPLSFSVGAGFQS
jgi:hypothetical protein